MALPDHLETDARAVLGEGTGKLRIEKGVVSLSSVVGKEGRYVENTYRKATILDYPLPQSVALPDGCLAIAFSCRNPEQTAGVSAELRFLVADGNGATWSVGTRGDAVLSRVQVTAGFERGETFGFLTSEAGRLDRWVLMPADLRQISPPALPVPPFRFVGLRLALDGSPGAGRALQLRDLRALAGDEIRNPYWILKSQTIWQVRLGLPGTFRCGWGAGEPAPRLKAADLGMGPGAYRVVWEMLDRGGSRTLASGMERVQVADADDSAIRLPLFPPGTYNARIAFRREAEDALRERFFTCVIVNGPATETVAGDEEGKPLSLDVPRNGIARSPTVDVILRSRAAPAGAIFEWVVESADRRVLQSGQAAAGPALKLSLKSGGEPTLWITAKLKAGEQEIDVIRRTIGFPPASGEQEEAPSAGCSSGKELAGVFSRTKSDWSEGFTPVATRQAETLAAFAPWLDEARETGYNIVELAAPWFDLNPLPGVYQFPFLDRLVAAAQERGLRVVLRVHPSEGQTPLWVPRELQADQDGRVEGIWGGDTLVYSASSPALRQALGTYLEALARHYRGNPAVLGYTLSSLYFDHDWIDRPWLGQYVDGSEWARRDFASFVQARHGGSLDAAGRAHGKTYGKWSEVVAPPPRFSFDVSGRLLPRLDALWQDWIDYKVEAVRDFRLVGVAALHHGDPACWVGLYGSDTTPLYMGEIADSGCAMAYGSMESAFPEERTRVPARFEPYAKIARTAPLVDVGMSNILLSASPGSQGFSNYWMDTWRRATLEPSAREADARLHRWFAVVDRLVGAGFVDGDGVDGPPGGYLVSFGLPLNLLQHAYAPRLDDYLKPYLFRAGADRVRLRAVGEDEASWTSCPYLYVPYCAPVLPQRTVAALVAYVENGGRLIVEAGSGWWQKEEGTPDALGHALGLPTVTPVNEATPDSEQAQWGDSFSSSMRLAFRTRPFDPPVNDQPAPWIHNILGSFLRPYRVEGMTKDGTVVARDRDGHPAAVLLRRGKGEVLEFGGVIDWLGCPGLSRLLDAWGKGEGPETASKGGGPSLLSRTLTRQDRCFVVGRRFVGQDAIEQLKGGKLPEGYGSERMKVPFSAKAPLAGLYRVRELISGLELGVVPADQLYREGISLDLAPGEGFLLEADPAR